MWIIIKCFSNAYHGENKACIPCRAFFIDMGPDSYNCYRVGVSYFVLLVKANVPLRQNICCAELSHWHLKKPPTLKKLPMLLPLEVSICSVYSEPGRGDIVFPVAVVKDCHLYQFRSTNLIFSVLTFKHCQLDYQHLIFILMHSRSKLRSHALTSS